MQYIDRLRNIREEAIHFESVQRKVSFHNAIPRYKWEEVFLNYGGGQGCGILSEEDRTTTVSVGSAPEATTGQFSDAHQEISEAAPAAITMPPFEDMPPLEDAGPPEGAITPDHTAPELRKMIAITLMLAAKGPLIILSRTARNRLKKTIHQLQIFIPEIQI